MPHGKLLILLGLIITAIGAALLWAPWLVNWFGKLPGDIRIERENGSFYFPVTSMILVSVILTVLLNWLGKR
jgi:hypothetical protein